MEFLGEQGITTLKNWLVIGILRRNFNLNIIYLNHLLGSISIKHVLLERHDPDLFSFNEIWNKGLEYPILKKMLKVIRYGSYDLMISSFILFHFYWISHTGIIRILKELWLTIIRSRLIVAPVWSQGIYILVHFIIITDTFLFDCIIAAKL